MIQWDLNQIYVHCLIGLKHRYINYLVKTGKVERLSVELQGGIKSHHSSHLVRGKNEGGGLMLGLGAAILFATQSSFEDISCMLTDTATPAIMVHLGDYR